MLSQLLRRFCAPLVVSAASKEQLCLTLASVAHMYPRGSTLGGGEGPEGSNASGPGLGDAQLAALVSRAAKLVPACSGRELGMIAGGCAALGSSRTDLVDLLAGEMLWQCVHGSDSGAPSGALPGDMRRRALSAPRLADLTALLHAAIAAGHVCSATLRELVVSRAPALMLEAQHGRERPETMRDYIAAVDIYFGGGDVPAAAFAAMCEAATAAAAGGGEAGAAALGSLPLPTPDLRASVSGEPAVAAAIARRLKLLRWVQEAGCAGAAAPPPTEGRGTPGNIREMIARQRLYQLHCGASPAKAGGAALDAASVADLMQQVAHYRISDPVATETLEALTERLVASADSVAAHLLSETAFVHSRMFPALCARLRQRSAATGPLPSSTASSALQRTSPVAAAYRAMLAGRRPAEETLLTISETFESTRSDDVAQAAALFATYKEVSTHMAAAALAAAPCLTLAGVAALVWGSRRGQSGALLVPAEAALRTVDAAMLDASAAPLEVVAELLVALGLPLPRGLPIPDSLLAESDRVSALAVDLLLALVLTRGTPGAPTLRDIMKLVTLAAALAPGADEVTVLVCDRAAKSSALLSHEEVCACLGLLLSRPNFVHEALMDRVADHMSSLVGHCSVAVTGEEDGQAAAQLLDLARLQFRLAAPELEGIAFRLVHAAASAPDPSALPAELLAAATLLAMAVRNRGKAEACALALAARLHSQAEASAWLSPAAVLGVQDAVTCLSWDTAATTRLTDAMMPHVSHGTHADADAATTTAPQSLMDAPPLSAAAVRAGTVALYCRLCSRDTFFNDAVLTDSDEAVPATPSGRPSSQLPPLLLSMTAACATTGLSPAAFTDLCASLYRADPTSLPTSLAEALVQALPRVLDGLSPEQIARSVWGLGQLPDAGQRLSHQLTAEAVSDYALDNADMFWSGPDIATMLYGFSRLHCTKRSLYSVFASRLSTRPVRATMNQAAIGMALSAFGTVKVLDKDLFDRLASTYTRHAAVLAPADLLQSVKAHSRVMLLNDSFYDAMAQEVVRRPAGTFPLPAKCELLQAYGGVGQASDAMAAGLLAGIAAEAAMLPDANAAVDVLTALWLMNYDVAADANAAEVAQFVEDNASELTCASLLKLSSVLSDRTWLLPGVLRAAGDQLVALKQAGELTPEAGRAVLDVMARYNFHHRAARTEVAQLARSVSKEVPRLSEEEEEQFNLMLSR